MCFQVPNGALLNKSIPGKIVEGEFKYDQCLMHTYNNQTNMYSNKTGRYQKGMQQVYILTSIACFKAQVQPVKDEGGQGSLGHNKVDYDTADRHALRQE